MILVVCLLRRFLKNRLSKFVFPMLWALVLLRLLVPFSLSSPISGPVPDLYLQFIGDPTVYLVEDTDVVSEVASEATVYRFTESSRTLSLDWQLALLALLCLGGMITVGILLYQKRCYLKKLKNSLLIEHNETINTILREMEMGHILVFTNDEIASPLVCGIFNPRIYLPTGMNFQQTQFLQHILIHETMHIKRKDNWLKTAMLIALCLNWYNPLVWLMSKYLSSDLESACDAAVLKQIDVDQRQNYAYSLLTMAITENRPTLLFSAFSKTEVERRIKNVLSYKKATSFTLALSIILLLSTTIVFATGGQGPFSAHLSSYCGTTASKWGVKAGLTRDIALGENPGQRADHMIFDVLEADETNDPEIIAAQVKTALAKEFGVEKGAFRLVVSLCLSEDEIALEYAKQGITKGQDGFYLYKGDSVRIYEDEMLGSIQTRDNGMVDISVRRNRLGEITSVTVWRKGDREFDRRTKEIERIRSYDMRISNETVIIRNNNSVVEESTSIDTKLGNGFFYEQ
ncbi:M56 family metallopeptidase [Tissierella carlieri]|uniref:M56 family metallopeptidase n=1 Tax=Tissierella TaxID=41273 RepID=UPI001F3E7AB3|nr:M56 family metallopeptidase [Tissierella sp. P1]